MRWDVVGDYLVDPQILTGVVTTVELTVLSQIIAIGLGFVLAMLRESRDPIATSVAQAYVWFFRAVPLLVQLLFWYNIALLIPQLSIPLPDGTAWTVQMNDLISGFTAAILGLALNESAYMAEIVRGGILSIPRGQMDAALSIGLERGAALRKIVLPQTIRVILPPTGNQFIGLLKASSLVSVIGGGDLLTRAEYIYGANFLIIPLLIVATIWYVALVTVASVLQYFVERAVDPDSGQDVGSGLRGRIAPAFRLRQPSA